MRIICIESMQRANGVNEQHVGGGLQLLHSHCDPLLLCFNALIPLVSGIKSRLVIADACNKLWMALCDITGCKWCGGHAVGIPKDSGRTIYT